MIFHWPTKRKSVPFYGTLTSHLWWRLMPGTVIKVRWPRGKNNADPWDHYGPWLKQHVGRVGWDFCWDLTDDDMAKDLLTIKFRWGRERQAMMAAMMWQ